MLHRSTPATGDTGTGTADTGTEVEHGSGSTVTTRRRLRVVKPTERVQRRGRFNRYAPWGTTPFHVMFDLAGVTIAGMAVAAPWWAIALFAVSTVGIFATRGLYRASLNQTALNGAPEILLSLTAIVGVGSMLLMNFTDDITPLGAIAAVALAVVAVMIGRTFASLLVWFARTNRLVSHNVLVLGAGKVGTDLVNTLREQPKYGLMPVGYYDPQPSADVDMPTFDATQDVMSVIERLDASAVIVAFSKINDQTLIPILRACDRMSCEIFVVPRLFELLPVDQHNTDSIGTTSLIRLRRATHRSVSWRMKRVFDFVASGMGILFLSPVLIAAAIGSKIETGSIFFRQERVGLDGRRFDIIKFQSMKPADETESATNWNISNDDRVGRVGRFLRKSSIDELPQLWNVLKGDMSLVGPRPERPHFVGQFSDEIESYSHRHRVPSGLTGFAQVEGLRGDTSITDRARYDNAYVESWSLWTDIKILLRSVISVVTRRGS